MDASLALSGLSMSMCPLHADFLVVMLSASEASPREAHPPKADRCSAYPGAGYAVERYRWRCARGPFAPLRVTVAGKSAHMTNML